MLRVTIDILPGGDSDRARTIGIAHISNVSELADRSDYEAVVTTQRYEPLGIKGGTRSVKITNHLRRQDVTALLAKVFEKASESPCCNVCRLDADGVCKGCGRTTDEIREAGLRR